MKQLFNGLLVLVLSGVLVACQSDQTISFEDQQLEDAIRAEIDMADGEINESDVNEITELDLSSLEISSLVGIDSLDALEKLSVQDNEIMDFSLLSEIENLKQVNVSGNPFEDNEEQLALLEELAYQGVEVVQEQAVQVVGSADGPGGFLWKVADEDTEIYLQGTIHAGTSDFYPLHEKIEQAYAEADVVVPEIDMTEIDQAEVNKLNMELGMYRDGSTIEDHIPEELYAEVSTTLEGFGISMDMVNFYKPWILSNTIQQLMTQQLGFGQGVDNYFINKAVEDGKEIIGLETMEEQLQLFAETSEAFQVELLEDSLMSIDTFEKDMQQLFDVYKEGDQEQLLKVLDEDEALEEDKDAQAFMEALNDDRNYKMADKIRGFLEEDQDQTYFVIVGSLHLIQEPHIRSILEEEGYEVEHIH